MTERKKHIRGETLRRAAGHCLPAFAGVFVFASADVSSAVGPPPSSLASAQEISLDKALNRALAHNRNLVLQGHQVRQAELGIKGAEAGFAVRLLPDSSAGLTGSGNNWQYGLTAAKPFITGTELSLGGNYQSQTYSLGNITNATVSGGTITAQISQPLFRNFGTLVNGEPLVRAHQGLKSALRHYEQQKDSLILDVIANYEGILQLQRQIESDEALSDRTERLFRLTQAKERLARATRVDSLRVESQRGAASARLASSRDRLDFTRRNFAEQLGDPPTTEYRLKPSIELQVEPPSLADAVTIALSNRLDYAQAIQDRQDAERATRIAQRGLYPALNLISRYSSLVGGGNTLSGRDEDWFIGVAASSSFNPAAERVSIAQARQGEEAAKDVVEISALSIAREVQQAIGTYRAAQAELGIQQRNQQIAEARVRLAQRMFEAGKGDNFTVTDAEAALADSQSQLLDARSTAHVAAYRLVLALGTLSEHPEDLRPAHARDEGTAYIESLRAANGDNPKTK